MNLELIFKLSLYAVTALAGWILGVAEEGWIPYGSLPMVVAGYFWSERRSDQPNSIRTGMNDILASVFGSIALIAAMSEFFSENVEGRLLSGTHLVVYLTWIVLLQQKTNRRCWLLLALGLLQLAVASVLANDRATIWFGICSMLYVFSAVWTLSVFTLYRSASQLNQTISKPADRGPAAIFGVSNSRAIGSVQNEDGTSWISMPFVTGVGFTFVTGFIVSALFFVLIPRVWIANSAGILGRDDAGARGGSKSGFTEEVRLGDMGSILESMTPVFQIRLFEQNRKPMAPQEYAERLGLTEPLFRGAAMSNYQSKRWKADSLASKRPQRLVLSARRKQIRQEILVESVVSEVLFCMGLPQGIVDQNDHICGTYQWVTDLAYRTPEMTNRGNFSYAVYSDLPPIGASPAALMEVPEVARRRYYTQGYLERNKQLPEELKRLKELAQQVVNECQQRRGRHLKEIEVAQALEEFLRDSGRYKYSLDLSIQDPKIDPVEDFLFNRKSGHCEYFATALVLMLRSVGIPARLISGFKGGEFDVETQALHVQQRHSHAWCEAWIDDRAWVTLDATPVNQRMASIESVSANRSIWTDLRAQLAGIWSDNVVNISLKKQEELIYRPLLETVLWIGAVIREMWVSPNTSFGQFFTLLFNPRKWISVSGIRALLIAGTSGSLLWFGIRHLRGRWQVWRRRQTEIRCRPVIAFYERFVRLMKSRGLHRAESQTQLEFARQAAEALQRHLQVAGLSFGPTEISDLFYKVRFGNQSLPEDESKRVEQLLAGLEQALLSTPPK